MKTIFKISAILSLFLMSCTSMQHTAVNDDLYYSPKDEVNKNDQYAFDNVETDKSKTYTQNKELDQKITALLNDESKENIDTTVYIDEETGNPYSDIVVDSYEEARQKRIDAKQSGYYGTTNYFILTSSDYWYASAYLNDPFYNVIVVGDQVWVEPSWMTSSFGFYRHGWYSNYGYYGYYDPYYYNPYYYYPYYSSYYSPYYSPYYYRYPYYTINNYYYGDNNNWAGSSLNSSRRRGTTTTNPDGSYRTDRTSRSIPETYLGNDIRRNRTVKDGLDEQSAGSTLDRRTERVREKREGTDQNLERTTRVSEHRLDKTDNRQEINRKRTSTESSANNQTYTRTTRQSTSTYDASKRTNTTRYTRPARVSSESGNSKPSTYSPGRSGSSSRSGGSTYTPARSSGSSSGTVRSTPSKSSSGSSRSSGSSSSGSSNSSGSSSKSQRSGRR